jgi:hypothetical protein
VKKLTATAVAALLVAACDGGGGAIMSACMENSDFNRATCDCITKRASADLNAEQRGYLVRAMQEDDGIDELPIGDQMQLATFMADAGMSCAVDNAE